VSTALGDLVNQFSANGYAETARAWVATGPNPPLAPSDLQQALGSDAIQELLQKTGIPKDELLNRLSAVLPAAVDTLTRMAGYQRTGKHNASPRGSETGWQSGRRLATALPHRCQDG
jgi:uncharacterized protein YidB (DUF937 family)